jgi:hypothetical protein
MTNVIQFIHNNLHDYNDNPFLPEPALQNVPEWFKDSSIEITDKDKYLEDVALTDAVFKKDGKVITGAITSLHTTFTIKKCMPVFDAMTAGYLIKVPQDITVFQTHSPGDDEFYTHFNWGPLSPIGAHGLDQVEGYPHNSHHKKGIPKFINPWIVKTPPGYSCLFLNPMHQDLPFSIIPGVVDTDTFDHAVNFPFTMKDKDFDGVIKAGTPFVQIIPFKRDEFSLEVYSSEQYLEKVPKTTLFTKDFPDSYKKTSWHKKIFK